MASLHYSPTHHANSPTKIMRTNNPHATDNHHYYNGTHHTPQQQFQHQMEGRPPNNELSPLQKLQIEYQAKLEREKQKKINALQKRWMQEAKKSPTITNINRRARNRRTEDPQSSSGSSDGRNTNSNTQARFSNSAPRGMQRRPRQLPPLTHVPKSQSFHEEQTSVDQTYDRRYASNVHRPRMNPVPEFHPNEPLDINGDTSPPPNIHHLRLLREKKLHQKRIHKEMAHMNENIENITKNKKMSDFERWQQERDAEKMARLQKRKDLHDITSGNIQQRSPDINPSHPTKKLSGIENKRDIRQLKKMNPSFKSPPEARRSDKILSPKISGQRKDSPKRQEAMRQKVKEREIEKLREELRRKQIELREIQRTRLDSSGNGGSGSENESDHERVDVPIHLKPILKPVKVKPPKHPKNPKLIAPTDYTPYDDEYDDSSEIGFQMKPVLVRRDGSAHSSKASANQEKLRALQHVKAKHSKRSSSESSTAGVPRYPEPQREHSHASHSKIVRKDYDEAEVHGYQYNDTVPHSQYSVPENTEVVSLVLVPCGVCGRKFTKERLAKHSRVCAKASNKKRKVFDMTKARVQGTEMEKYNREKSIMRSKTPPKQKSNWKDKHENFIKAIRDAKMYQQHIAQGGKASDLPPPPPTENPDYVQCKYCERKFAPGVAERHIPRCKDIKSRPKPPRRR